jgi:hypothetical protein
MSVSNDDLYSLDKFVGLLDYEFRSIENFAQYIRFSKDDAPIVDEGLELLRKKLKKMKKSESVSELEEYVKINKVLKNKEDLGL